MADKYRNFAALFAGETSGTDFRILVREATLSVVLVAIHGGGIEPGTSELADAIAGEELSIYAFEGLKPTGNSDLHITSTRFDEPMCLALVARCDAVITIHGEHTEVDGEGVFLGGRATALGELLQGSLTAQRFPVRRHPDHRLQGLEARNICNRGKFGQGVQLELSRTVRTEMFQSLSREGRKHPTPRFHAFVDAIRAPLGKPAGCAARQDERERAIPKRSSSI